LKVPLIKRTKREEERWKTLRKIFLLTVLRA